jgi:DNA repair protein RadC
MKTAITDKKNIPVIEAVRAGEMEDGPDPGKMSDRGLLSWLLALNMPHDRAHRQAGEWLCSHGGLRGLLAKAENGPRPGQKWDRQMYMLCVCSELVRRHLREGLKRGTALSSPADTLDYLQHSLQGRRREVFQCMFLDTRHRVICHEELFQGSIDGACVYPRVVAEHALRHNAAAVIVAHNHPSGVTEPSLADQAITRRLKDALKLLEIRLLDHFIIGDGVPVSMAARGMT